MRYIRLSTEGIRGMRHDLALKAMRKARQQRPGEGEVMLTRPAADGTYYAIFGHLGQAQLFTHFLHSLAVDYTELTELPAGLTVRAARRPKVDDPTVVVMGLIEVLLRQTPRRR